jgi:outer membrane murein-binding lipoprotein Lpp
MIKQLSFFTAAMGLLLFSGCTQETQNKLGRAIQNWTGTNGILEVYAGDKLVKRFMKIDKLSTAVSTDGDDNRPYRYGYGVLDENLDGVVGKDEKRVYFEFSDYSTSYVFYESPHK